MEIRTNTSQTALNNLLLSYSDGKESEKFEINTRKPAGFWENKDNYLAEAKKIAEKYGGKLPPLQQLQKDRYFGIINAAHYHHGGLIKLRTTLGEKLKKSPNGHWTWERVTKELKIIAKELGHFPGQKDLTDRKRNDLNIAISRKHGGLLAVRKKLGYPDREEKPAGYWQNWNNFEKEIRSYMKDNETIPSENEFQRKGINSIETAIQYHGGRTEVRKRLGLSPSTRKPSEYWQNIENVRAEIKKIMHDEKLTTFPEYHYFRRLGHKGLLSAINVYHRGIIQVRNDMGFDLIIKRKSYWKKRENVIKEVNEFLKKHNLKRIPCYTKMQNLGSGNLSSAIMKYHGGFRALRESLGEEQLQRPNGVWKDLEYTLKETKGIMEEEGWEVLPGCQILTDKKYGGLNHAITKYHGGFRAFRVVLEKYLTHKTKNINIDTLLKEYVLDNQKRINERSLTYKSKKNDPKPKGFWNIWENVENEMRNISSELGFFPTYKDLKLSHLGLLNAVNKYYGGLVSVKERIGYVESPINPLESILESYIGGQHEN